MSKKLLSLVFGSLFLFPVLFSAPLLSLAQESSGGSSSQNQTREQMIAEIERRLIAIAIELARLLAGLPPNTQGGAYPILENTGATVPGGNIGTTNSGQSGQTGNQTGGQTLLPGQDNGQDDSYVGGSGGASGSGGLSAGGASINQPFGGMITNVNYSDCDCSNHQKVEINPAKSDLPRTVLYQPGASRLYAEYQLQSGRYLLGWYVTYAVCMKRSGYYCYSNGTYPLIAGVGTSGAGGGTTGQTSTPEPRDDEDEEVFDESDNQEPRATSTPASPLCDQASIGGWTFNSGIRNQTGDASESLKSLLYCVCNKLQKKHITGKITSISDSNHIGRLYECRNPNTYNRCGSGGSNCCYHSRTSCHYGGDNGGNKSYAADIGMAYAGETIAAVAQCGGSSINEGNHIHVATRDCRD